LPLQIFIRLMNPLSTVIFFLIGGWAQVSQASSIKAEELDALIDRHDLNGLVSAVLDDDPTMKGSTTFFKMGYLPLNAPNNLEFARVSTIETTPYGYLSVMLWEEVYSYQDLPKP